ncbi:phage gene 29 protein family protein [Nocardia spumae]|uniref:phage gene 29 protein family protein n=1 Tax=Nocardia spumae TaxID=2887190 RepID=UPI001D14D727|nr:hypothetical protein [Nocardia spumae]
MPDTSKLFGEGASQADMLMLILDSLPGQRDDIKVPIHPKSRRPWAEALIKRGVRIHPELMEEFPIPGDHPEAGFMNPNRWVSPAEYEKYAASRPDDGTAETQLMGLLEAVNPGLAKKISSMTPEERAAAKVEQKPQMQEIFERMHEFSRETFKNLHGGQQ